MPVPLYSLPQVTSELLSCRRLEHLTETHESRLYPKDRLLRFSYTDPALSWPCVTQDAVGNEHMSVRENIAAA